METFIQSIVERLREIFDPQVLGNRFAQGLKEMIVVVILLILFYSGWRIARKIIRPALKRSGTDETTVTFVETLLKYTLLTIGIVTALGSAGIQISAILASLGIVGLTIGFAARDALSNIISGILIYLDRPFVIGDLIEMEGLYGKVAKITLRSTRIITVDGKMLAVPNTEIINKTVASYTNFPHLRLDVAVTVAVDQDLDKTRQVLLNVVNSNSSYLQDPPARVVVTHLNDYNVTIELQAWLDDERNHLEERFDLRERIYNALIDAGIEMPFETIQLSPFHVKIDENDFVKRKSS